MSSIFWKNFYICFAKWKCPSTTLPSQQDHSLPSPTTTSTLIKNFNSLYHLTSSTTSTSSSSDHFFSSSDESDTNSSPPNFAAVFASQRFFFPSPSISNSIIESPLDSSSPPETDTMVAGSVAVQTYSPDPYLDFRRSMQEMVEARQLMDLKADWDYLHELLLCYLTLNPKHTHKFIVGAFSDLLISLMSSTTTHSRQKFKSRQRSAALPRLS